MLICGGSSGIGLSTAKEFSKLGANVTLFSRSKEKLKSALEILTRKGNQTHKILVGDFNNPKTIKAIIEKDIIKTKYSILINNSGGPRGGELIKAKLDDFIETFNRHLICNHILTQTLLPFMKINNYGRIINIISTSVKQPIKGLGVSNTIRGAVASWAKTLSMELEDWGITVNNILPGYTDTNRLNEIIKLNSKNNKISINQVKENYLSQIPLKRFAHPKEISNTICFIASKHSSYINGTSIPIDGGRLTTI